MPMRPDDVRHDPPRDLLTDAARPVAPAPAAPADLEPDVERLHRAIVRESPDPEEGREPAPWWLWTGVVLAIFWGGWYLGRYGGTFGPATHVALGAPDQAATDAVAAKAATAAADPVAAGHQVFTKNCQACHQATGGGLPGAFPPLVGSEWAVGSPEVLARILLNGLQGPVTVAGGTYNGAMPAWRDQLKDDEIAAVLTYVRQWAPNRAGPIAPALVGTVRGATVGRSTPWTAAELRALGAAAPASAAASGGRS